MANAAGPATPQKVFDMVIMAVQAMEVMGAPETIKEIQNPKGDFVDGEIYLITADCETGKCLAHPMAPHLVEKNVDMLTVKDKKGTPFFARLCEIAAGKNGGWMEYWWPKPGEKTPSRKLAFAFRTTINGKEYMITSGLYDDNTSVDELNALLE